MIVIDAGVVITALLPEAESPIARSLIATEVCVAPDLIISECVNALWKNVKLRRILPAEAEIALETVPMVTQDGRFLRKVRGSAVSKADLRLLDSVKP